MEFRNLGASGLKVSAIAYGNWLTHGSPGRGGRRRSPACSQALDEGITTFDTADVYADTRGRDRARQGAGWASGARALEIFTKVYCPIGAGGPTTTACRASTSWSRSTGRCVGSAPTTSTSTRRTASTTRRRSRRRWRRSPTSCTPARPSTSASRSGRADELRRAHALARELHIPLVSNQPQYNMLWRVIEDEVVPASAGARHRPDRVVADRPGRADRQVQAGRSRRRRGRGPPTTRAARDMIQRYLNDDVLERVQRLRPRRRRGRAEPGPARRGLGAAERQRLRRDRRRQPPRAGDRERQGRRRPCSSRADGGDRRGLRGRRRPRRRRSTRSPDRDF